MIFRSARVAALAALALSLVAPSALHAQASTPVAAAITVQGLSPEAIDSIIAGARPDDPATLTVANRDIVVLRAALLGRSSAARARAAAQALDDATRDAQSFEVSSRPVRGAAIISVNGRDILAIVPADVDQLLGETVEAKAGSAVPLLRQALAETQEASRPSVLLWAVLNAVLATLTFGGALWVLARTWRWASTALERTTLRSLSRSSVGDAIVRQTRLLQYVRYSVAIPELLLGLAFAYVWLFFVLRRFPYSRPWGESLRHFLVDRAAWIGAGLLGAVPNLFTVALIYGVVYFAIRLVRLLFLAAEEGRVTLPGVYPDTATTTRKLVTALLWAFALVMSYPFLPGSGTDAFKGISVFVGLMVSLGSSGLVNQVMSGLTVTYSRALRVGDFVRVGDVEGTVVQIGSLSTKIETLRHEEVTIPNAVLVSQTVTNYSRNAEAPGVFMATEVTIGYDTPWRQVEALLLLAVSRTSGVRPEPAPRVFQIALEDFYVRYRLLAAPQHPHLRWSVLNELHANIQDSFNEHGVQIMSPNYMFDPSGPKVVPKGQWFAPPAVNPAGDNKS